MLYGVKYIDLVSLVAQALEIYDTLLPALGVDQAVWTVPGCIAEAHRGNHTWTPSTARALAEHVMAHCTMSSAKGLVLVVLDLFARHVTIPMSDGTDEDETCVLQVNQANHTTTHYAP